MKLTKIGNIEKNLSIIEYLMNYIDTKENIDINVMKSINLIFPESQEKYSIPLKIKKNKMSMTEPINAP
jgi:hypothetical protein